MGGIVKGRATKGAQLQLTLTPSWRTEHNEGVCQAKWRVVHSLRLNQNIEGDLCQGLKDLLVRAILKDGSRNAIAFGQPLEGLQLTCLGRSGRGKSDSQYHVQQMLVTYLLYRHVWIENLPQV